MFDFIKKLVRREPKWKKPQGYFSTPVVEEEKPIHPLVIEAGDLFLKYVSENSMLVGLDSDSLLDAQYKIKRNNEIIDRMPTVVIPCGMSQYENDLRKCNYFRRDINLGGVRGVIGYNWYNEFWSYVNSKTDQAYYGVWAQQTREVFVSQNSAQHIIDYFYRVHNLRLEENKGKFTVVL
jgi:hypothetical protein